MSSSFNTQLKRWPGWIILLFLVVLLVLVGAGRGGAPQSKQERTDAIAKTLACQVCNGESVYESRSVAATNMRNLIEQHVDAGVLSNDEIISDLESTFGEDLLLLPTTEGINVLVWALPVAAAVAGGAGLVLAFAKWRRESGGDDPSDADRVLVAAALAQPDGAER